MSDAYDVLRTVHANLRELAEHPAFAGDAPEFNQGGIGYESCRLIEEVMRTAPISARMELGSKMREIPLCPCCKMSVGSCSCPAGRDAPKLHDDGCYCKICSTPQRYD